MGLTGLFAVLIPDVPNGVKIQIQREKLLAREVLFDAEIHDTTARNFTPKAENITSNKNDTTMKSNGFSKDEEISDVKSRKSVTEEEIDSIEGTIQEYY